MELVSLALGLLFSKVACLRHLFAHVIRITSKRTKGHTNGSVVHARISPGIRFEQRDSSVSSQGGQTVASRRKGAVPTMDTAPVNGCRRASIMKSSVVKKPYASLSTLRMIAL